MRCCGDDASSGEPIEDDGECPPWLLELDHLDGVAKEPGFDISVNADWARMLLWLSSEETSGISYRIAEKFGLSHFGQIHTALEFARLSNTEVDICKQGLWLHVSQLSQQIASWLKVTGDSQTPHG